MGFDAALARPASSHRVPALVPDQKQSPRVTPNPEAGTDPIYGTIQERAAVFTRPTGSSPDNSGRFAPASDTSERFAPASEAQSCTTQASIVNFDDAMAVMSSELLAGQRAAGAAVANSDSRAMAAEVAVAQARSDAQDFAARAAGEVLTTRDQAKQALGFSDQA